MNALQSLLSRRALLRGGAALGLSTLAPSLLLSACGGGSDDGSSGVGAGKDTPQGLREKRTLNFNLSAGAVTEPRLQLYNSQHHGQPLLVHTQESRAAQRSANPALAAIPDERLTHYLPDVDLPAAALQTGAVVGKHPRTGAPVLVMPFLHVPSKSLKAVADRRAKTPLVVKEPRGLLRAPTPVGSATPLPSITGYHDLPRAVALWMIFQHPAITNLDPDLGGDIVDRINSLPSASAPYLYTVMYDIGMALEPKAPSTETNWPTTTNTGSWATLVLRKDAQGNPVLDSSGNPVYSYTINPALAADVGTVVKQILNNINNDAIFSGTNWQPSTGAVQQTPVAAAAAAAVGASSSFSVTNSQKIGSRTSGIRFKKIECADDRSVALTVANEFLRSASVFVEYRDATGTTLAVDNSQDIDTSRSKYIGIVSPDVQIMGIPFVGATTPTTTLNFTMPDKAAEAIVYYGGIGLGGDAFHAEALLGSIVTLVINIGLPAVCLAGGIFDAAREGLIVAISDALLDEVTIQTIMTGVVEALGEGLGSSIQTATTTLSLQAFLAGIGETVLDIFLKCCPRIGTLLAAAIAEGAAQDAIPIIGLALWALSTAADIATIGETVIECLSCPAIDTNIITLTMDQAVSVSRDPNDYEFPATATQYTAVATYDGKKSPNVVTGPIAKGTVGPLGVDLGQVASGGNVVVEVTLTDANGSIVGYGKSDSLVNLPATAAIVPVTIQERVVPLSGATSYQHSQKLVYQNGAHAWSTTGAPSQTVTSLKPGADNALTALYDITVHTASGMAGYAFAAGGQGINLCGGASATDPSSLRNVFLGNNPDSAAKFSNCGASQPMCIVYDANSKAPGGNNFFLQPGGDGFYHLRGTTLDSTNFDMAQPKTWGRFSNPMTKLCVVGGGYVVGVNRDMHKMEILTLPAAAQPATNEVVSAPFSSIKSGFGNLPGLLDTPVSVCAYQNNVLVLEQGNLRVQAFDPDGSSTTPPFLDANGNATPIMALKDASADATYLDIGVEGLGYIYVLWYSGDGSSTGDYHLDVYTPTGAWMARTSGVAAGALAVDVFRNVYTLNYETVAGAPQVEPSLSQWLPHNPA